MEKPRHDSQPRIRLAEARNVRGWSQVEVAERIGTTYVNVSHWERGITRPSPYFRKKLAGLFGKSEQELDLTPDLPLDALSTTNSINPVPSNAGEQDADKQRPYYGTGLDTIQNFSRKRSLILYASSSSHATISPDYPTRNHSRDAACPRPGAALIAWQG